MVLALWSQPAAAQTVYTYTGNPFTLFTCQPFLENGTPVMNLCSQPAPTNLYTAYMATDRVTATLSVSAPLPPNLGLQRVTGLPGFTLRMSDGQQTLDSETAFFTETRLTTDANGQIVDWQLALMNLTGSTASMIISDGFESGDRDLGSLLCCDSAGDNRGQVVNMRGIWNSPSVAPSPAVAVSNLLNLVNNQIVLSPVGQTNSLTDKLSSVLASIQAGQNKQAINQLNAFIKSIQTLQKNSKVSTATATNLITAAQAIIAML